MKNLFLALSIIFSLTLTSCKELDGYISAETNLTLKSRSGETVVLPQGSVTHLSVKMMTDQRMKLIFDGPSGRHVVKIKTDFSLRSLQNGDKVFIPASQTGQSFDIEGIYRDSTTYSDSYSTFESCRQNYTERECHEVSIPRRCQLVTECNPTNPNQCKTRENCTGGGYQTQCRDITRTFYGQRDVTYHYRTKDIHFDMTLLTGSKIVGKISSSKDSANKVYTYQGICR